MLAALVVVHSLDDVLGPVAVAVALGFVTEAVVLVALGADLLDDVFLTHDRGMVNGVVEAESDCELKDSSRMKW